MAAAGAAVAFEVVAAAGGYAVALAVAFGRFQFCFQLVWWNELGLVGAVSLAESPWLLQIVVDSPVPSVHPGSAVLEDFDQECVKAVVVVAAFDVQLIFVVGDSSEPLTAGVGAVGYAAAAHLPSWQLAAVAKYFLPPVHKPDPSESNLPY